MLQKIISLILIISIVFVWSACKSDSTGPSKSKLQTVAGLKAFSLSNTSVQLKWTASSDESKNDFVNYIVIAKTLSGTEVKNLTVSKGIDTIIVIGLSNGEIYNFEVISKASSTSENYTDSDPATIKWSPAWRYETEGGIPIKVYETTSSSGFASGLIFYDAASSGPKTVSLVSADSSAIDVYVKTITGTNNVSLNSSHVFRSGRKITRFSSVSRSAETLNDPQIAPPDSTTYTIYEIPIDSAVVTSSKIYYYKGQNGNYGRILVMRAANGNLIWGSSPEQYLTMKISYQSVAYNPYSKTKK